MDIFSVVSRHVDWLENRHRVVATNIAHVDTPGYKAKSLSPFSLGNSNVAYGLAVTNARHMAGVQGASSSFSVVLQNNTETNYSGNDVIVERELRAVGENTRLMTLDTSMAKLFHRLTLASLKS